MLKYNVDFFGGDDVRAYFPRLIGNDDVKTRVGRAIENKSAPHAFLIGGASGTGKSVLALEMAAALNCLHAQDATRPLPCGVCNNCKRIYENNFPDVKYLSKPKERATLGVEAVKDFREDMFLSSTESEHKIYVIDDAELMTSEGQNALLKVLEEPPSAVTILLLARECDKILSTIKSRTQYIPMMLFSNEALAEIITERDPLAKSIMRDDPERFSSMIVSSDGRIGQLERLLTTKLSDENEEEREDILRIISTLGAKSSYADIYLAVSLLPTKRAEMSNALERLEDALRDLIAVKNSPKVKPRFFTSNDAARRMCADIPIKRLLSVYDSVNDAHLKCNTNANIQNLIIYLSVMIHKDIQK